MDRRLLRYFIAVAETGHLTRAAAQLGLQQPPLSYQIKTLETTLGVTLFQRHHRGVTLTEAGRLLLPEARRIVADMVALEKRMASIANGTAGIIHVAFTSSAAAHAFTPDALRCCRDRYPAIELVLTENPTIIDGLTNGEFQCGIMRTPPPSGADDLLFETLIEEHVVVAFPRGHALLHKLDAQKARPLTLKMLRDEDFILARAPGALGFSATLLQACRARGFEPRIGREVGRVISSLNLVAAGAGVAVVPASLQSVHKHAIEYRRLADADQVPCPLTLAYRANDCVGATATFVELLRGMARTWGAPMPDKIN